jgi:hypothetical protein
MYSDKIFNFYVTEVMNLFKVGKKKGTKSQDVKHDYISDFTVIFIKTTGGRSLEKGKDIKLSLCLTKHHTMKTSLA